MKPIKDGLKCWLEGADLTNSSTNWKDRSGNNNNFSIIGTPVIQNNMAVFSEDWYAKIDNLNINYGTIELTASFSSTAVYDNIYMCGSWEKNNYKYGLGNYRIVIRSKNNNSTTIFNKSLGSDINKLRTYGITFNENTCVIYYEGQIIETIKNADVPNIISFYLGYKSDSNKKGIGNIKSLKIYDRKLEPYEILDNYQYELLDRNTNSYVNENNLPKIVNKLSNASNIKITGNKYGNRVQTVIDKIVEKADNVTKAINQEVTNNSYSFKVGQGNNINVTSDVQDSFSNLAIKGVTYQNLILPDSMTKHANVTIENDIITLLDTCNNFEGITYKTLTKANITYTVVFNVKETFENGIGYKIQINDGAYMYNSTIKLGINKIKITTQDNETNPHIAILKASTAVGSMKFSKNILLLEGDYTEDINLPYYFKEIIGVGDKSKNLFNKKTITENYYINSSGGLTQSTVSYYSDFIEIDSNTTYTMGKVSIKRIALYDENKNFITRFDSAIGNSLVVNSSNAKFVRISGEISELGSTQFEKNSIATEYEPYWNGHKIEILSNGKNLFSNKNNFITGGSGFAQIIGESVTLSSIGDANHKYLRVELPVGKKYTVTIDKRNTYPDSWGNTILESIDNNIVIGGTYRTIAKSNNDITKVSVLTFETTLPYVYIHIGRRNSDETYEDWFAKVLTSFETLQIEQNDSGSSIEPYKEDKIEILLDEPLMRLPDGLCDEITKDGKLIRRIGKIVLDGSQLMFKSTAIGADGSNKFGYRVKDGVIKSSLNLLCNNFKLDKNNGHMTIQQYAIDNNTMCGIYFATLDYDNVTDFKQWLSQNPTTVYYELAEPIITRLSKSQIRIFKDGVIKFNTLVAPESTHIVQLNKSAQIQNTIKQSQLLDNKITVLENNYDSLMLFTMSTLNDLELDYTLK